MKLITILLTLVLYNVRSIPAHKAHLHKIVCDKVDSACLNCGLSYPIQQNSIDQQEYVPFHLDFNQSHAVDIIQFNSTQHFPMRAMFKSTGRNLRHVVITTLDYQPLFQFKANIMNMTSHFENQFYCIDDGDDSNDEQQGRGVNVYGQQGGIDLLTMQLNGGQIQQHEDSTSLISFSSKMTFNFINMGRQNLTLSQITSNGMSQWKDTIPHTIKAGSTESFQVDFGVEVFTYNSGVAKFSYGNISQAVIITAKEQAFYFKFSDSLYEEQLNIWTFPPPLKNNTTGYKISLLKGATLSLGFFDFYGALIDLQEPAESESDFIANYFHYIRPLISNSTLRQLFIAGTHDSGTYNMKNKLTEFWCKDQNLDIRGQLQAGSRVIDVRSGDLGKDTASQEDQFIFVHGDFDGNVRQYDGMIMIREFLDSHPDQIVVLDIHQQQSRSSDHYNEQNQRKLLLSVFNNAELGSYLIPQDYYYKQIGKIYSELTSKQRLILSWGAGSKAQGFWDSLIQLWDGNSISSVSKVQTFLSSVLNGNLPRNKLWSAQAEIWTVLQGPTYLSPYLENWFYSYGSWASKSYIVNVDFIEETLIPEHAIMSNMVRSFINLGKQMKPEEQEETYL